MNESPSAWHLQHQPFSWAWPSASSPIYNTIWVCCSRFLGSAGQCARLKSEIRALWSLASHFSLGFAGSGSLTFIYNRPSRLHMYTSIKTPATSSTSSSVCTIFVKESPESFQNPLLQKSQPDRFIILNIVTECRYWCLQPGAPVHPHPDDSSGICHPAKASYIRTIPKAAKSARTHLQASESPSGGFRPPELSRLVSPPSCRCINKVQFKVTTYQAPFFMGWKLSRRSSSMNKAISSSSSPAIEAANMTIL